MNRIFLRQFVVKALSLASLLGMPSLAVAGQFDWADQLFGPTTKPQILTTVSGDLKGESYRDLRDDPARYGVVLTRALQLSATFSEDMREGASLPKRLARWVENAPVGVLEKEPMRKVVAAFSHAVAEFQAELDKMSDQIKARLGLVVPAAAASSSSSAPRPARAQTNAAAQQGTGAPGSSTGTVVIPVLPIASSRSAASSSGSGVVDVVPAKVVQVRRVRLLSSEQFSWAASSLALSDITSADILAQVSEDLRNDSFDGLVPERYAPVLARALSVVYKFRQTPEAQNSDLIRRLLRWIEAAPAAVRADDKVTEGILSLIEGRGAHADFSAGWTLLKDAEERAAAGAAAVASRPATPRWGKNDDTEAASTSLRGRPVPDLEEQMARMRAGEKVGSTEQELDLFVSRITEHLSREALDRFISDITRVPFDAEVPLPSRGWGAWVRDPKIARPSVLSEIIRDFKGRSADFNSKNPQKYAKVLTRALELAYEFNGFIEKNLAHRDEKAVEIHSARNIGAIPGSSELMPALVEWINAAPVEAGENLTLQEAIGKLARHNADFARALKGVELRPFGRS